MGIQEDKVGKETSIGQRIRYRMYRRLTDYSLSTEYGGKVRYCKYDEVDPPYLIFQLRAASCLSALSVH